ncbi:MAG: tetratricopeptide repeat protein [Acidobacteriota bacterium]|nr:MAG: tetratricopeptide repeat protein [Acidobacteriota bacterium]
MKSRRFIVFLAVAVVVLAVAVAVAVAVWRPWRSPAGSPADASAESRSPERRNLILVTLDTTRADRLGCYGYERGETPALDRLAEQGVTFDAAYAPTPITLPSHATLLTGLYPVFHGVHNNGSYELLKGYRTLAEIFRENGWRTGAFISAFVLHSRYGMAQGFEAFGDNLLNGYPKINSLEIRSRSAQKTLDEAFLWLKDVRKERFFLWIHFFDPHRPYRAPAQFEKKFSRDPYDGQIAYMDSVIGEMLARLERWRILRDTLVVAVGDHGESLGEHKEGSHAFFIYNATMLVPLIFSQPGVLPSGKRFAQSMSLTDVAPTLLEYFDITPSGKMQGESVLAAMEGREPLRDRAALLESVFPYESYHWAPLAGLALGTEKYIEAPVPEYYDLARDPGETRNRWSEEPEKQARLVRRYREEREKYLPEGGEPEFSRREMSSEEMEVLKSLGYVFGEGGGEGGELRDPKDAIEILERLKILENMIANKDHPLAQKDLEEIVQLDPGNYQALYLLGQVYEKQKRWDEAVALFRKAYSIKPTKGLARVGIGRYYLNRGDLKRAKEEFLAAAQDMHCPDAHLDLAFVYLREGDMDGAIATLKRAKELFPYNEKMYNNLGLIYVKKGLRDLAREQFKLAMSIRENYERARTNLKLLDGGVSEVADPTME